MPLSLTKKAAETVRRRVRRACQEIRSDWTGREQRRRRVAAFQQQNRLAVALGLAPQPALAPIRRS